ncbi:MAG: hypothetical protein K2O73_03740, partial [Lachnospiraceae bacterium]|nr:hypothetical protein [Lachnospiraceae bacterium]
LSGDTISTYEAGSISDLPAFQNASLRNGLQKNYITQTCGLVENSEAIYKQRQEAWEEAVRQRKEQAMVSMIAAVGTLILGGVVIVCTFGAATPLVAGTTAVTLSSVVSVSASLAIGSGTFLYGESNWLEAYESYQYGLAGDARTVAVNPIRDTAFAADPGLYYTVGNACTMAAGMLLPVSGSMTAAVNAGTSPVRAGLTELGMLGYSSVMAAESADIVTDITDSKLAGMFAGTIVAIGSYGGLKSLDQSVNISGLYPPKETPNSYAELMPPEEAERYLRFLEKGSMEGLTDAEITAIRKVDDALALKKVDGQSVPGLRRPFSGENSLVLESGSNAGLGEYVAPSGGGGVTSIIKANGQTVNFGHGGRHLEGTDLNVDTVNQALANEVSTLNLGKGQFHKGQIIVDGITIEYTSYGVSDGVINVGTYYPLQ